MATVEDRRGHRFSNATVCALLHHRTRQVPEPSVATYASRLVATWTFWPHQATPLVAAFDLVQHDRGREHAVRTSIAMRPRYGYRRLRPWRKFRELNYVRITARQGSSVLLTGVGTILPIDGGPAAERFRRCALRSRLYRRSAPNERVFILLRRACERGMSVALTLRFFPRPRTCKLTRILHEKAGSLDIDDGRLSTPSWRFSAFLRADRRRT